MIKLERYNPEKIYMLCNGEVGTPERILQDFPGILSFTHVIETDMAGETFFACDPLNRLRGIFNIDTALTEDEAIQVLQDIRNAPPPEPEVSAEERIAAALEFGNILNMPEDDEFETIAPAGMKIMTFGETGESGELPSTIDQEGNNTDFDMVNHNYLRGLWGKRMVSVAVKKGLITQTQYEQITGQSYGM